MKISIAKISTKKGFASRESIDSAHVKEIAVSLKASGQQKTILVRQSDLELVDGQYRLAAAKRLGWKKIDAELRPLTDQDAHRLALIMNRGKALTEFDIAQKVMKILESVAHGRREQQKARIAREIGISP
jgi:ParB/RepB/Spo0J family partition protein